MIQEIINSDRRLKIKYNLNLKNNDQLGRLILDKLSDYLADFCEFYNLTSIQALESYNEFLRVYINDFNFFINSGKYPFEIVRESFFSRETYDLALILSIFFTPTRLNIFKETLTSIKNINKVTIIGVGAAVEIELIKKIFTQIDIDAYDLTISEFVKNRFEKSIINEREFIFNKENSIESFLLIELLEHLDSPYTFIEECSKNLKKNGSVICTTASNMPQFDHLYNFHNDDFIEKINEYNLNVIKSKRLNHDVMNTKIDSYNEFYHLVKQ